jgi:hypothetical protein
MAAVMVVTAVAGLVALPRAGWSQPDAYSAAPIRGSLVDAKTQQPLAGVHVVAQWILNTGMLFHSERIQRLHILETVTDEKGEYQIPGWGPKPRPPFSRLETADPRLTFFKPGYRPLDRSNNDPHDRPLRTSRWDGKSIPLEPFSGTPEDWSTTLKSLQIGLAWADPLPGPAGKPNDYWRFYPRIVVGILEERRLLPPRSRTHVLDLSNWNVSEEQVRALAEQ